MISSTLQPPTVDKLHLWLPPGTFVMPKPRQLKTTDWSIQPPTTKNGKPTTPGKLYLNHPDGWAATIKGTPQQPFGMLLTMNPNNSNPEAVCRIIEDNKLYLPEGLEPADIRRLDLERHQQMNQPIQVYGSIMQVATNNRYVIVKGEHYTTPSYTIRNPGKLAIETQLYNKSAEAGIPGNILRLESRLLKHKQIQRFGLKTYSDLATADVGKLWVRILSRTMNRIDVAEGVGIAMASQIKSLQQFINRREGFKLWLAREGILSLFGYDGVMKLLKATPMPRKKRYECKLQLDKMMNDIAAMQQEPITLSAYQEFRTFWAA